MIEIMLEYFGTSWAVVVAALSCVGILIVFVMELFMCLLSGFRSQIESEREFNKWLREQLESMSGDQWNGEDEG